jgi:hypothetical protein
MTYVFTQPQGIARAAASVAEIGSAVREANAAAAGSTTSVVAAAQDEVSAAISALFGSYGQEYRALTAQTMALDRYGAIDGRDLVAYEREQQKATQQELLALYEAQRRTDINAEADAEAAVQEALAAWEAEANARTQMLKSTNNVLNELGRG